MPDRSAEQSLATSTLARAMLSVANSSSSSTIPHYAQDGFAPDLSQTLQPYPRYTPSSPSRSTAPGTAKPAATMYRKSPHSQPKSPSTAGLG
ncbi:hypothetical protein FIBSPDRAFT_849050 [Athelia psychrophila]|uniref:Uncharacterized protein n=1 Tax=Athelia psychrophila TaxID=1759441 RepID=A0A166UV63_9AGAM|nr:hypothetical protein FIBSPDRAFT_849050 [Fibularhizoctonia sp. CBS 109695]